MNAQMRPLAEPGLPTDLFRVYEATDPFHAAPYRLCLRQARERCFFEDIASGRRLVRLGPVVLETRELVLARALAQALYL